LTYRNSTSESGSLWLKKIRQKRNSTIYNDQLAGLRELMPQAFTEGKIDVDKLRASLGDFADEGPERYSFTWAGKRDAIRILQPHHGPP